MRTKPVTFAGRRDTVRLIGIAWQGVWAFKSRSLLTSLSLILGIFGIVSMHSAAVTAEAVVTQKALLTGGPVATYKVSGVAGGPWVDHSDKFAAQLARTLGPNVSVSRAGRSSKIHLGIGGRNLDGGIDFVDPTFMQTRKFPVLTGRWLAEEPGSTGRIVLNKLAAGQLESSQRQDLLVRLDDSENTVRPRLVGVVEDGRAMPAAYMTFSSLQAFEGLDQLSTAFEFSVTGEALAEEDLKAALNRISEFGGFVASWEVVRTDNLRIHDDEVRATSSMLILIGLLGALASGIAVANVGLVTLRERSAELSLRRALGARRWEIPVIMILESQIIALFACFIAIAVSMASFPEVFSLFAAPHGVELPEFPAYSALIGCVVGMGVTLLASLAPALRSARLPVALVLRT